MTITLKPEQERIVQDELRTGQYRSVEDVIDHALQTLRPHALLGSSHLPRDPKGAAARIRERRKSVTLGGLRTKDLVNEGRH